MSVPGPAREWGQWVGCSAMTSSGRSPVDLFVLPPSECGCDTPVGIPGGSDGGREGGDHSLPPTFWQQTQVLGMPSSSLSAALPWQQTHLLDWLRCLGFLSHSTADQSCLWRTHLQTSGTIISCTTGGHLALSTEHPLLPPLLPSGSAGVTGVCTSPTAPSPELLMDSGEYGGVVLGVRGPAGGELSLPH